MSHLIPRRVLQSAVWVAVLTGLAAGELAAQIVLPPSRVLPISPPRVVPPPIEAIRRQPLFVPPLTPDEVGPAEPPEGRVSKGLVGEPLRRTRYGIAVLQALDKVTAESQRFEAPIGQPVRWKGLIFTVRACERSAPNEAIDDAFAYLTIESQPRSQSGRPTPPPREAFSGWMFASSPGLNPLEHVTYDAWVVTCRAAAPSDILAR